MCDSMTSWQQGSDRHPWHRPSGRPSGVPSSRPRRCSCSPSSPPPSSRIGFSIALGAAGAFVVVSLFGLSPDSAPRGPSPRSYRWMPFAWLLLFLVSDHQFDLSRSPLDAAAGLASVSNVIELAAYGAIALLVAVTWNRYHLSTSVLPRWGSLVVLPLLAILSTLWSVTPEFTLVRSAQLLIPLALSVLLGKVWMSEPALGRESWGKTCRCLVVVVAVLVNLGFIFSSVTAGLHKGRFTWPGMHPVHAGVIIGAALLTCWWVDAPSLASRCSSTGPWWDSLGSRST